MDPHAAIPGFVSCVCPRCKPLRETYIAGRCQLLDDLFNLPAAEDFVEHLLERNDVPGEGNDRVQRYIRFVAECGFETPYHPSRLLDESQDWDYCLSRDDSDDDAAAGNNENTLERLQARCDNGRQTFMRRVDQSEHEGHIRAAFDCLGRAVVGLMKHCMEPRPWTSLSQALRDMRHVAIEYNMPLMFNSFMSELKRSIFDGTFGIDSLSAWTLFQQSRLNIIQQGSEDDQYDLEGATAVEYFRFYYEPGFMADNQTTHLARTFFVGALHQPAADVGPQANYNSRAAHIHDALGWLRTDILRVFSGDNHHDSVILAITLLRRYAVENDLLDMYNGFITSVKTKLLYENDFPATWRTIELSRLGPIEEGRLLSSRRAPAA